MVCWPPGYASDGSGLIARSSKIGVPVGVGVLSPAERYGGDNRTKLI